VSVPAFIVTELVEHIDGKQPDQIVFESPGGGVLRSSNFRRDVFAPAAGSVGLDGLVPHGLRHTAASLAIASGADVKVIQIPDLVVQAATRGVVTGVQGTRPVYATVFNGKPVAVAVTVGDNGYIVGANIASGG
jgi:integrase